MSNLSFYGIEAGEATAPVSSMYKHVLMELINFSFDMYDEKIYRTIRSAIRVMLIKDETFRKTPPQFQKELLYVLELDYEEAYERVRGISYEQGYFNLHANKGDVFVSTKVDTNTDTENNSHLTLVK